MAKDLNLCQFIGRLGRDPETRYLNSGTPVAQFSIAVGDSYKNKDGEKVESAEWVNVEAWGKLAELCETYLAKGDRVYISGPMKTNSWEDQDGNTRYKTIIRLNDIQFLNTKGADDNGGEKSSGKSSGKSNGKSSGQSKGKSKTCGPDDNIPF